MNSPVFDSPVRKPADEADARGMIISSIIHQKNNVMLVSSSSSNRKINSLKAWTVASWSFAERILWQLTEKKKWVTKCWQTVLKTDSGGFYSPNCLTLAEEEMTENLWAGIRLAISRGQIKLLQSCDNQ